MAQFGVSFVATVYAWDTSAGTYKTGDSANITLYWNKDGTNSQTTNSCSEVSSANVPGQYKVTITAAEAACTAATLGGKSSTSNIIIIPQSYAFDATGLADVGTLQSATGTTAVIRSGAVATDSFYKGATLFITSGTGAGQSRLITAYTGSSKTATVDTWTTNPDNTSTYAIIGTPPASTSSLLPVDAKAVNAVSTSNVTTINANLGTTQPQNFTGTGGSALVKADTIDVGGTAQTARDLGASVLLSSGTGTGQLDFTSGVVKANLAQILGTALTETSGQIAAAFKKFFNIATPASTMDALTLVATATNLTNAPTSGDLTAAMKTSVTTAATAATPSVNVAKINNTTVNGDGAGTPWGP